MSHLKERKERICLNCNANLYGRYCHVCGQENLELKETVWHLTTHFFNDITHFDGKFFSTVKLLITKPGFLSKEYMIGRRASYLNPIRMYVFTSAIFFLIFFSLAVGNKMVNFNVKDKSSKELKEGISDWEGQKNILEKKLVSNSDKDVASEIKDSLDDINEKIAAAKKVYGDTTTKKFTEDEIPLLFVRANLDSLKKAGIPNEVANKMDSALKKRSENDSTEDVWENYKTVAAYDSAQLQLPENKKDGFFKQLFNRKLIAINEEVRKDKKSYFEHFKENLLHSFPKILFISLPFFALILKLVYIRRKQFYYTNHGIFAIHLYCAIFILMLLLIILYKLSSITSWLWLDVVDTIISVSIYIYVFIYTYKAMRVFYMQRRFKTFLKYCIVGFLALIVDIILFTIFTIISAISI
ncbi:MAG TPA: DUF3667 domain-containing protein [Puia sp.]|nr:DUF3667 domain-containing protein [Puia sp.]